VYGYLKLIIQFVSFVRTDVELDLCFIRLLLYPYCESFDATSNIIVSCETPAVLIVFLVPKTRTCNVCCTYWLHCKQDNLTQSNPENLAVTLRT